MAMWPYWLGIFSGCVGGTGFVGKDVKTRIHACLVPGGSAVRKPGLRTSAGVELSVCPLAPLPFLRHLGAR